MSNEWGPAGSDRGDETGSGRIPPPPQPPDPSPVEPVLSLESETEITRKTGTSGRVVAGILGALALIGGTLFAVSQLGASGPESPEEAVASLLDAVSNEDVLGMLAALDPAERDALREPVEDLFDELERLEVLDDSFSLSGVEGVDVEFADVTYRSEPVRDDLVRVYFTGGTVSGTIDGSEVPVGDFVSDTLDRFGGDIDELDTSEQSPIADTEVFLVARNGSDGWRVSIGYTAAEAARIGSGLPLSGAPIVPVGADSPEAAVEGLARAAARFDARSVIARLSPGEFGALQDYAGLFIDDVEQEMAEASQEFEVTIDDLSLRSEESGDRASVFVDGFAVTVTSDEMTTSVSYADGCFSIEGDLDELELEESPFAEGPVCVDQFSEAMEDFYGTAGVYGPGQEAPDVELPTFPAIEQPTIGITTTRVDGEWFVAPIATALDAMVGTLEVMERSHLDAIVDYFEEMERYWEQSASVTWSAEGGPLPGSNQDPGNFPGAVDGPVDSLPTTEVPDLFATTTTLPGASTTVYPPSTRLEVDAALEEMVRISASSAAAADCILGHLADAPEYLRYELADAYLHGYQASTEAHSLLLSYEEACQAG